AIRMSDCIRPLGALKLKASIVVLDAARANPFAKSGPPLAGGLALVEPEPGVLIAFNAAPGTVAPEGQGPYGAYAQALAEMLREGGLPLAGVFDRARLRVNDVTKGAEVPWHASKVETSLVFFERAPDAPPPAVSNEQTAAIRARPIRVSARRKPMPRRWSATRWTAIRNSSPPIPTTSWLRACAPSLPPGARRSRGGGPALSTRRPPIGLICGVIRRGRTRRPMRTAVWLFLPPRSSRRRSRP